MNFITGEKFKSLADYIYTPEILYQDDFNNYGNTLHCSLLKDFDIIYTHTMFVKQLFEVIKDVDKSLILISHNSDTNVDESFIVPDNIIKWYAQNVNVVNPKIESIPIGLENNRWFPERRKKEQMIAKLREPREYRNLMYMNHSLITNPIVRGPLYDMFEGKSWVTSEHGSNGIGKFENYLDNIYNHKFTISPQGNGLDTHRTWECLYMGVVPIEKRNINNQFYADLPICLIDDWSEITQEFLGKEFDRIKSGTWNMDKITFQYWANRIR
jgi:hypothetical protein